MKGIINWIRAQLDRTRVWWNNNHEQVREDLHRGRRRTGRFLGRLARNISRILIIGVLLNIVVHYFYPEFAERFPVIFGWFDGWLQFAEFALKGTFGTIYSIFTGKLPEFWSEYNQAFQELLQQFNTWLSNIHF